MMKPEHSRAALPRFSIVVPMHNAGGTIERCLDGLAGQTIPLHKLEVIVVDAASCDGSSALACCLAAAQS